MQKINQEKAGLLYDEIERNKLFQATVPDPEDRSLMNVEKLLSCQTITRSLEKEFGDFCQVEGDGWYSGHRSVGGFKAVSLQCTRLLRA